MSDAPRQARPRKTLYVGGGVLDGLAQSRAAARLFHRAGGTIAIGTDCGAPGTRHGDNARELALLVDAGLSPLDALRAATAHGATLLGLDDEGRVIEGAHADFLIVDGDPTIDIAVVADVARHRMVVKHGLALERTELRPATSASP